MAPLSPDTGRKGSRDATVHGESEPWPGPGCHPYKNKHVFRANDRKYSRNARQRWRSIVVQVFFWRCLCVQRVPPPPPAAETLWYDGAARSMPWPLSQAKYDHLNFASAVDRFDKHIQPKCWDCAGPFDWIWSLRGV